MNNKESKLNFPVEFEYKPYRSSESKLKEGTIICFVDTETTAGAKDWHQYFLLRSIGGLRYIFGLEEKYPEQYELSFKTKEHGLAVTNAGKESSDMIGKTISAFLEGIEPYLNAEKVKIFFCASEESCSVFVSHSRNNKNRNFGNLRLRLFKIKIKKYLPGWTIEKNPLSFREHILKKIKFES